MARVANYALASRSRNAAIGWVTKKRLSKHWDSRVDR